MDIREKISRLADQGTPRVLDLFAGCGGLSLGFQSAGFDLVAAVEIDSCAAASHAVNFFKGRGSGINGAHRRPRDIVETSSQDLVSELNLGRPTDAIDVIVGGPPCQAYARVGRAKLREVSQHPSAFLKDPRRNLYLRYLDYVRELVPIALLMENVPDMLNHGGHNIAEEMCDVLEELGYVAGYTLLNAANYGVPQMRDRVFLLAYRREIGVPVRFPIPTHSVNLPRGYEGTRQVALKPLVHDLFQQRRWHFLPTPTAPESALPAVSAEAALRDLPRIDAHLNGGLKRGQRNLALMEPYAPAEPTEYGRMMRTWTGYETNGTVSAHVIRSLPRDYEIFRVMNPGDQYPQAHQHAKTLFRQKLASMAKTGREAIEEGSAEFNALLKATVPPYDPTKFPNKWRKMEPDQPARTIMAHIGKDSYTHIHYDSSQARTISVREAARLQSFPDAFEFVGAMNSAFRQIGNAVPPLLAQALATEIRRALEGSE
jgi:DNA (cytosine-5)-methyltransferase 1